MSHAHALTMQAFVPQQQAWAWVGYDAATGQIQVSVSNTSSKPATPQLVARVNVSAALNSTSAFVGFTGGTSVLWWTTKEHHIINNFTFQAGMCARGSLSSALHSSQSCWSSISYELAAYPQDLDSRS